MKTALLTLTLFAMTSFVRAAPVSADSAFAYLSQWEGNRSSPYRDVNQWCVGVGHVLHGSMKKSYSPAEIRAFFDEDFANTQRICRKGIKDFDSLPADAQLVSIGLAFCCGPTGFMEFRDYRLFLSYRKFQGAADSLKLSLWWNQVKERRAQESYQKLMDLHNS